MGTGRSRAAAVVAYNSCCVGGGWRGDDGAPDDLARCEVEDVGEGGGGVVDVGEWQVIVAGADDAGPSRANPFDDGAGEGLTGAVDDLAEVDVRDALMIYLQLFENQLTRVRLAG